MKRIVLLLTSVILLISCVKVPEWVTPVKNFQAKRFMGTWYEVARLDHKFEHGMNTVSSKFSMTSDGKITIRNEGYMVRMSEWRNAEASASFIEGDNVGLLKVAYMKPFYDPYVIFKIDPEYEWAFVCGKDRNHLWLLSRYEWVDDEVMEDFKRESRNLGFDLSELIEVKHI